MNRAFAALAFAALATGVVPADAQSPRPSPAITGTQAKISHAKAQDQHALAATKAKQKVSSGGSHSDSESALNPGGSNKAKPGTGGPGYGAVSPPRPSASP